ncbi:MAG: glycosyltransferase family 9 protein [Planctomycetota bacterium]
MSAIVLCGLEHLREALLSTGPTRRLREQRDDLRLLLVASEFAAPLLERGTAFNATIAIPRRRGPFGAHRQIRQLETLTAEALSHLGVAPAHARFVSLSDNPLYRDLARRLKASHLARSLTAPGSFGHTAQRIARALGPFGLEIEGRPSPPALELYEDDTEHGRELARASGLDPDRPFAILHPGGSWLRGGMAPPEAWPLESYAQLGQSLGMMDLQVGITAFGRRETQAAHLVLRLAGEHSLQLVPDAPLRAVASLMRAASVVCSHDTSGAHLATAAGARLVSLARVVDRSHGPLEGEGRLTLVEAPGQDLKSIALPPVVQAARRLMR